MPLEVVILAAGQGTRMKSSLPKVLHPLAGRPMVGHVLDTARHLQADKLHVVVGHGSEKLCDYLSDSDDINIVEQTEQLGTGHAVAQSMSEVAENSTVLILYGDVPLISESTLSQLVDSCAGEHLALLTVTLDNPSGYGRILRSSEGEVLAIVEQKDANIEQLKVKEVNTGIMALPAKLLNEWLPKLSADNTQGEYYLTDIIAMAAQQEVAINASQPASTAEVEGVNNRLQLAKLERVYQKAQTDFWMAFGVSFYDPARVDFRGQVELGQDVSVDINVIFEGSVRIGNHVSIGPNCVLKDCVIGDGVTIKANSLIEESQVAADCEIGPFARLRPGTELATGVKIGNFVETKKAIVGEGSKINHLSYVGDSELGKDVNIGAGTITCNYDGVNKHKTEIGDNAFIGSNTALVAPVSVGKGSTTGAGSTITKAVPDNTLAVARGKQIFLKDWKRPEKA